MGSEILSFRKFLGCFPCISEFENHYCLLCPMNHLNPLLQIHSAWPCLFHIGHSTLEQGWWKSFSPSPKDQNKSHFFQEATFSERKGHHYPLLSQLLTLPAPTMDRTPSFQAFQCNSQLAPRNYLLSVEVLLAAACKFLETDSNHFEKLWSSKYIKAGCYLLQLQTCE